MIFNHFFIWHSFCINKRNTSKLTEKINKAMKNTPLLLQANTRFEIDDTKTIQTLHASNESILLDVSMVQKTNTAVFNLLLETQQRLFTKGQILTLIGPSAYMRTWLYVTKLQQIIPSFPNLAIANAYVQKIQHSSNQLKKRSRVIL